MILLAVPVPDLKPAGTGPLPCLARAASAPGHWPHLRTALWIFLTFSVLYVGLTRGRFLSTDEIEVYQATRALWERGDLSIESPEGTPGRDGKRFPVANSGLSVAALPLYGLGKAVESVLGNWGKEEWLKTFSGRVIERAGGDRWGGEPGIFFVNLFNCFATALVCALFYCFTVRIGTSGGWALLSTALLGLTSYIAPLSTGFFQHSSEALFLLAAFYFLFLDGQRPDWRWRLLAGAMTALLIQFRFPSVIAVPCLLLYHCALVWRRQPGSARGVAGLSAMLRQLAPFSVALAFGFILHAADQFAKFGTIWVTGRYAAQGFQNPLLVGLYGFLFSPGDSIFLFTPLFVLLPWTLRHFSRFFRAETIFIVAQSSVYLIFYSKYDMWHGLWCFGPRYVAAIVPLLMLPLGPWLEQRGRSHWLIVAVLALLGLWMQIIHFAVDFWNVALRENYLTFQPQNGFLFIPASSQVVAHSKALLAWDWRVNMWLVTVYRTYGIGRFLLIVIPLAVLLGVCLWQVRRSLRAIAPAAQSAPLLGIIHHPRVTAAVQTLRTKPLLIGSMVLMLAIFAGYSNHFQNGFHFDDAHTIENNAFVRDLMNIPRFFTDATTFSSLPSNQSYRPIVSTTLAIDHWLGGGTPFWFQVSGFFFFLLQTLLLGVLVRWLLESRPRAVGSGWLAVFAAACYGLHPANADTVNYIIARCDVVSTLAVSASLVIYIGFPRLRGSFLYLLPAMIGILAKPPAAMFAPLFAIYILLFADRCERGGGLRRHLWPYLREIAPAFIACGAMVAFVQFMTPKTWVAGAVNAREYLITQPYVALLYFKTFLWPSGLSADYDLAPFASVTNPRALAGFAFTALLFAGAVAAAAFRRTRVIGFGLLWFVIALLPTSLLPLAEVMNSHRTFFPYAGLIIAAAGAISLLLEGRTVSARMATVAGVCALLLLCAGGYGTRQRNKVWKDESSLWRDVTIKSPNNGRGLMNYGNTLMAKGELKQALGYFERARRLTPNYPTLLVNLGVVEAALGRKAKAQGYFKAALQRDPRFPDCYTFYARWLLSENRYEEALPLLRTALKLSPGNAMAIELLSRAESPTPEACLALSMRLYSEKRYVESIAASQRALKARPNYAEAWNNMGAAYNSMGRFDKGAAACEMALSLKPDFPLARNNLNFAQQMASTRRQPKPTPTPVATATPATPAPSPTASATPVSKLTPKAAPKPERTPKSKLAW